MSLLDFKASDLSDRALDEARRSIGAAKLAIRLKGFRNHELTADALDKLRPLTAKIAEIHAEYERRQSFPRRTDARRTDTRPGR